MPPPCTRAGQRRGVAQLVARRRRTAAGTPASCCMRCGCCASSCVRRKSLREAHRRGVARPSPRRRPQLRPASASEPNSTADMSASSASAIMQLDQREAARGTTLRTARRSLQRFLCASLTRRQRQRALAAPAAAGKAARRRVDAVAAASPSDLAQARSRSGLDVGRHVRRRRASPTAMRAGRRRCPRSVASLAAAARDAAQRRAAIPRRSSARLHSSAADALRERAAENSRNSAVATSARMTKATSTSSSEKPRCARRVPPSPRAVTSDRGCVMISRGSPRGR